MESNQDQALMRGPPDHRANGPDIPLSGYAAGLVRLAVGLYVIRCAVSHHNHQGCITISNLFPFLLLTLRHRWSVYVATPFHPHLTYSIHRNSLDNHGTSQPLRWCRQSEPFIFIGPGSAKNNFSPCRFRTAHKEGPSAFNLWCHTSGATARLMRRGASYGGQ